MKKILISSAAFATLAISGAAFAQDAGTAPRPLVPPVRQEIREERKDMREEVREERKDVRETVKEERKDMRENIRETKKDAREIQKEMKTERKDMRTATSTEARAESQKRMDENKKNLEESRKKAGIERANYTIKRLERQVVAMDKLATRIAERLVLIKSKGGDTSKACRGTYCYHYRKDKGSDRHNRTSGSSCNREHRNLYRGKRPC